MMFSNMEYTIIKGLCEQQIKTIKDTYDSTSTESLEAIAFYESIINKIKEYIN